MKKTKIAALCFLLLLSGISLIAGNSAQTGVGQSNTKEIAGIRTLLFENKRVRVWKTVMKPKETLELHRHAESRVEISLSSGEVEILSASGVSKTVQVKKDTAYWRDGDPQGELHSHVNLSDHPLEFIQVEVLN